MLIESDLAGSFNTNSWEKKVSTQLTIVLTEEYCNNKDLMVQNYDKDPKWTVFTESDLFDIGNWEGKGQCLS